MHRFRNVVIGAVVGALAVSAFGAPAAASDKGTVAIVNGIPGGKVDICINGKEIKSGVKYGGKAFKTMVAGPKLLKVRKAGPGKCKGKKLAGKGIELTSGADLTLVATKKVPRVIVFENVNVGQIPPTGPDASNAYLAWRHAADIGDLDLFFGITFETPIGPAADPPPVPAWQKGDGRTLSMAPTYKWRLSATRPGKAKRLARSRWVSIKLGRRYEWYLVGTKPKNAKFVVFSRAVSLPTP